jgi:hypothetical protein
LAQQVDVKMANIFQIPDYSGTVVALGEHEWTKKILSSAPTGHPEVRDYIEAIRQTLVDPDLVFESTRRSDARIFYRLNAGQAEYAGKHLVIVVKYVHEAEGLCGYVSTAYLARGVFSKGRLLWQRKNMLTD